MFRILLILPFVAYSASISLHAKQSQYSCQEFTIPVDVIAATSFALPFAPFQNQYEATSLSINVSGRQSKTPALTAQNLTRSIMISAEYCTPSSSIRLSSTLQILTHGLGFNRSYWEFVPRYNTSDTQYNYIGAATAAGFSTLSYNRLGIKGSSMADPYNETQLMVELQVLATITKTVREGRLPIPNSIPSKILHVGHSFGSQIGAALAAHYPDLSDGLVLTAYSANATYAPLLVANSALRIASQLDNATFPDTYYGTGFVTWTTEYDNQYSFFHYPSFDPAVLAQAEATKQPIGIGELLATPAPADAPDFTGPVLYLNAEYDLIMCGANCTGSIGPSTRSFEIFEASRNVESMILPDFGHALNLHYDASSKVYTQIMQWAARNGL